MGDIHNDIRSVVRAAFQDRYGRSCLLESTSLGNIYVSINHQILRNSFDRNVCQIVIDVYPSQDPICTGYVVWQVDDEEEAAVEAVKIKLKELKISFQKDLMEMQALKGVLYDEYAGHGKYLLFDSRLEHPRKTIHIKHRDYEGDNPMKTKSVILDDGKTQRTYVSIEAMIKDLDFEDLMRLDSKIRDKVLK